jgi:hypothetical protein
VAIDAMSASREGGGIGSATEILAITPPDRNKGHVLLYMSIAI